MPIQNVKPEPKTSTVVIFNDVLPDARLARAYENETSREFASRAIAERSARILKKWKVVVPKNLAA